MAGLLLFVRRGLRMRPTPRAYVIEEGSSPCPPTDEKRISLSGGKARLAARARARIGMCAVVFCCAFAAMGVRLTQVSLGVDASVDEQLDPSGVWAGHRPEIVDRNGALLATNLPLTAVDVAGREVWDPQETAHRLSQIFPGIRTDDLAEKLKKGRYVQVAKDVTPAQRAAIFDLGLPGVRFRQHKNRYYPQGKLASHVIGHTIDGEGDLGRGVMGLEGVLDRSMGQYGAAERIAASIDIKAQQVVEAELARAKEKYHAKAAWAALMDVDSGEVIALASLPDFDPNRPGAAAADWRRNRVTYDRYELGSAFKAVTAAAVIEADVADETSTFDARAGFRVADRAIGDFHGKNRVLSLSEVVQHSSNIGMARAAAALGVERHKAFLKALGLFDALDIELAENRMPQLPEKWGPVEAATVSYGHGISVTPLHLLAAFSAVVNGGVYRTPSFLHESRRSDQGLRVFSEETSLVMRRILRRVVIDGSASAARAPGYFPIGKTATAEKPQRGGYASDRLIASFIGAFPGFAPRYALLVSLDEPVGLRETHNFATAGWNAAPTFARMTARLAPVLGVMRASEADAISAFLAAADKSVALAASSERQDRTQ